MCGNHSEDNHFVFDKNMVIDFARTDRFGVT